MEKKKLWCAVIYYTVKKGSVGFGVESVQIQFIIVAFPPYVHLTVGHMFKYYEKTSEILCSLLR